jgi:hypothetical protein
VFGSQLLSRVFFWNQIAKTHIWSPCKLIIPVKANWYRDQQRLWLDTRTGLAMRRQPIREYLQIRAYSRASHIAVQMHTRPPQLGRAFLSACHFPRFLEAFRNQITLDVRVSPECSSFLLISSVGSFYSVTGCVLVVRSRTPHCTQHTCCPSKPRTRRFGHLDGLVLS